MVDFHRYSVLGPEEFAVHVVMVHLLCIHQRAETPKRFGLVFEYAFGYRRKSIDRLRQHRLSFLLSDCDQPNAAETMPARRVYPKPRIASRQSTRRWQKTAA